MRETRQPRGPGERFASRSSFTLPALQLLAISGVGDLIAARLLVETGGARFATDSQLARHAGCAPIEVSSGRVRRHRLSRMGNRKLNAALHQVVLTQARVHPPARAYLARKRSEGKSNKEAFRCLKRHLVRVVWRALRAGMQTGERPGRGDDLPSQGDLRLHFAAAATAGRR